MVYYLLQSECPVYVQMWRCVDVEMVAALLQYSVYWCDHHNGHPSSCLTSTRDDIYPAHTQHGALTITPSTTVPELTRVRSQGFWQLFVKNLPRKQLKRKCDFKSSIIKVRCKGRHFLYIVAFRPSHNQASNQLVTYLTKLGYCQFIALQSQRWSLLLETLEVLQISKMQL